MKIGKTPPIQIDGNRERNTDDYQRKVMTNIVICTQKNLCVFCHCKLSKDGKRANTPKGFIVISCKFNGMLNEFENNVTYCAGCHYRKHDMNEVDFLIREWGYERDEEKVKKIIKIL